jgi:GTP-binding protein EngB required for normal cell division
MRSNINFEFPRGNFPRLCLVGNSNVGKSSITRWISSQPKKYKHHTGKTPGSTSRLTIINDLNTNYQIIDLPGFGYIKRVSRTNEGHVMDQILNYLELDASNIFLSLVVIAANRLDEELEKWYFQNPETIPLSVEFVQFITDLKIPCLVVLNKIDKLNKYQKKAVITKFKTILQDFRIFETGKTSSNGLLAIIPTSAKDKNHPGIREVKRIINQKAQNLNMAKYDARHELLKKKPISRK